MDGEGNESVCEKMWHVFKVLSSNQSVVNTDTCSFELSQRSGNGKMPPVTCFHVRV